MSRFDDLTTSPHISGSGYVSNSNAAVALISNSKATTGLSITNVMISVTEAAIGGGGILEIRAGGVPFLTFDVNAVGIVPIGDFGDGLDVTPGVDIDAVVSGAQEKQASVNVAIVAYATHV